MEVSALIVRFALGIIFSFAGLSKLRVPDEFARVVRDYGVLPPQWSRPLAVWLPRIELASGILLLLGIAQRAAAVLIALMLVVFIVGGVTNLVRGRRIDCGCFGVSGRRQVTWWTIAENLALALAAVAVISEPASILSAGSSATDGSQLSAGEAIAILISTTLVLLGIVLLAESRRLSRAMRRAHTLTGGPR